LRLRAADATGRAAAERESRETQRIQDPLIGQKRHISQGDA
jgi:hypothetical protein